MKSLPIYYVGTFPTPVGAFSIAVDEEGAVRAAVFGAAAKLSIVLGFCKMEESPIRIAPARQEVEAYFQLRRTKFSVRLAPTGSPHQRRVWRALCAIPFGETRSYGQLAARLRSSARAVGRANATNPIGLLVPCHRVIGADGSLTGYAYGIERKRRLLSHESARGGQKLRSYVT